MSRSYRHTPIIKSSRDGSNRYFTQESNRRFRRRSRNFVRKLKDSVEDFDIDAAPPNKLREVSQIYCSRQEYKWKEFGDFWGNCLRDIEQNLLVYPYYTDKSAKRDLEYYRQWYYRFFGK